MNVYIYTCTCMFLLTVYFLFVVDGTHCHNYASEFKHSQNVTQKQVRGDLHVYYLLKKLILIDTNVCSKMTLILICFQMVEDLPILIIQTFDICFISSGFKDCTRVIFSFNLSSP